jgi:hypothetical protein
MFGYTIFHVYVIQEAFGFAACIVPLDGGLHVLARSSCPTRARQLGLAALNRLEEKRTGVAG